MKLKVLHIENFCAYKELDFSFENLGLCLLSGETKAGKSTILDAACWILYGTTSKDSASDDIRSWFTKEPTQGNLVVETATGAVTINRVRGSATQNDLYWTEETDDIQHRGKDLKDTQKLLEARLSVSSDLYITGSYMHQFSGADAFFTAKAKDRRDILEKLADLSLPIKLSEKTTEARKLNKKRLEELEQEKSKLEGKLEQISQSKDLVIVQQDKWNKAQADKITNVKNKLQNFEIIRENTVHTLVSKLEELSKIVKSKDYFLDHMNQIKIQIKALQLAKEEHKKQKDASIKLEVEYLSLKKQDVINKQLIETNSCPTCSGGLEHNDSFKHRLSETSSLLLEAEHNRNKILKHLETLEQAISVEDKIHEAYDKCRQDETTNNRLLDTIAEIKAKINVAKLDVNRFDEELISLEQEKNPNTETLVELDKQLKSTNLILSQIKDLIFSVTDTIANLTWLYNKSFEIRALMLEKAKNQIQDRTNGYLEKHFDGALRVNLSFEDLDKLQVEITNDGYSCPYKQLSGGERCMLKLAFNLSLMKMAETISGVKFNTIMLDEALNGLDGNLKEKAFGLLQSLEQDYDTILLIDHFEAFQELFTNKFVVEKINGYSVVSHAD